MDDKFQQKRKQMIEGQIISRGIRDQKVLSAMKKIPRHKFVPLDLRGDAYNDYPLPIGYGQTISQPYIVAYMTELLEINGSEKILEVGTGCGYQTAVLAEVSQRVVTIDIIPELVEIAKLNLSEYDSIEQHCGDGWKGYGPESPYDRILVAAAPEVVPAKLVEQLAEGGIMILPVGSRFNQRLIQIRKVQGEIVERFICGVVFVPLVHG